jgi:hypothetical protein
MLLRQVFMKFQQKKIIYFDSSVARNLYGNKNMTMDLINHFISYVDAAVLGTLTA